MPVTTTQTNSYLTNVVGVCKYFGMQTGHTLMGTFSTAVGIVFLPQAAQLVKFIANYSPISSDKNFQFPGVDLGNFSTGNLNFGSVFLPEFENTENFDASVEELTETLSKTLYSLGTTGVRVFAEGLNKLFSFGVASLVALVAFFYIKTYIQHTFGQPTLSRNYKFHDWKAKTYECATAPIKKINEFIFGKEEKIQRAPVLNANVQDQLNDIIYSLENVKKHNASFSNVLLWGPPGTGKSMTAKYIAENFGMNYIEISGGDLAKFINSNTSPVEELNRVFTRINSSEVPTVLFIDEIEGVALDRSKLDPARVEIQNALLNLTGTASNKYIIMAATNRPEDLDTAILNRFDDKIKLDVPEKEERLAILRMYIEEYFDHEDDLAVFSGEFLARLNEMLAGHTGRTIQKLINKCNLRRAQQDSGRITEELTLKVFDQFFKNEEQIIQASLS